jgi:hypothetical protein
MDDSEKPTIETAGLDSRDNEWKPPEPVFRSTPGRDPRVHDVEKDIPTEPANKTEQSVRVKEDPLGTRHQRKKKGGCARFFTLLAVLIGLLIGSFIVAAVYFLYYYRPLSTTF